MCIRDRGPPQRWLDLARRMAGRIAHRGPDAQGAHFSPQCVLAHARLAVIDPEHGHQPMSLPWQGATATIAYNGEIYNAPELRQDLESKGFTFSTSCQHHFCVAAGGEGKPLSLIHISSVLGFRGNRARGLAVAGIVISTLGLLLKLMNILELVDFLPWWFTSGVW